VLPALVEPRILEELVRQRPERRVRPQMIKSLSEREFKILQLIAQGYTNQQMADIFNLSFYTVVYWRGKLMRKVGRYNRAELISFAIEHGLLSDVAS
jgi:DNA-binding NarL/FixJ family response regulator